MIDEGIVLGRCEPVLTAVEEMRKAGVTVFIGYQSFTQMADILGKTGSARARAGWMPR
jgi:type IV secretory pathway TraG/TraD family ATPase VirD4